jgi:hypothetical protein
MNAETTLTLLTRDGSITVTFRPALAPDHYQALYQLVVEDEDNEGNQLCDKIKAMATQWGVELETGYC